MFEVIEMTNYNSITLMFLNVKNIHIHTVESIIKNREVINSKM